MQIPRQLSVRCPKIPITRLFFCRNRHCTTNSNVTNISNFYPSWRLEIGNPAQANFRFISGLRRDPRPVAEVDPYTISDGHGVARAQDVEAVKRGVPRIRADKVHTQIVLRADWDVLAVS